MILEYHGSWNLHQRKALALPLVAPSKLLLVFTLLDSCLSSFDFFTCVLAYEWGICARTYLSDSNVWSQTSKIARSSRSL